jgi:hypothetical protein
MLRGPHDGGPPDEPVAGPSRQTATAATPSNPSKGKKRLRPDDPPAAEAIDAETRPTTEKGSFTPRHSESIAKYSSTCLPPDVKSFLYESVAKRFNSAGDSDGADLAENFWNLLSNSLARSTWNRYVAALNLWYQFCHEKGVNRNCFTGLNRLKFICWNGSNRKRSPKTVSMYLGSLDILQKLNREIRHGKGKVLERSLLKGMGHLRQKSTGKEIREAKNPVIPVNLLMLDKIRIGLKSSGRATGSVLSVWTACLVAFWGLFHLGELLPKKETSFDKFSNLLWEDVVFIQSNKRVLLNVRSSKRPGPPGNKAELFAVRKNTFLSDLSPKHLKRATNC